MSEDLSKKLEAIADILNKDGVSENIANILSSLLASGGASDSASSSSSGGSAPKAAPQANDSPSSPQSKPQNAQDTFEMFRKLSKLIDKTIPANDPRINLLNSLKPFVSNKRQQKINNCINILRMSSITRLLEENPKDIF